MVKVPRGPTRDVIVKAAISLFNTKGYDGTSIRDIAAEAKVNAANIAYYFRNKQGLLEYCLTSFYEMYIEELEKGYSLLDKGAEFCLKNIVERLLRYQCEHPQLTRLILREMSIDSQMVREIMSTYLVKERYYFRKVLEKGIEANEFRRHSVPYSILQIKGLLSMPFLNTQYVSEVLYVFPHEKYFADKYTSEIHRWINAVLCKEHNGNREHLMLL